jgi:CPA2 family monovalent cation:H+ antiporter-2
MAMTPFVIGGGPMLSDRLRRVGFLTNLRSALPRTEPERKHLKEHVMIIGYGVTGRNLARAAKVGGIPYVIIELNPETCAKSGLSASPSATATPPRRRSWCTPISSPPASP